MKIFLIILLSYIAFTSTVEINSFDNVTYQKGTTEFTYNFSGFSIPEGRNAYFYFQFSYKYKLKFNIINEKGKIEVSYSDDWNAYYISELNSQKYTFQIINEGSKSGEMVFIDSTKEINTNIDVFLNLDFHLSPLYRPPLSLIFNIDTIQEEIFYNYIERYTYGDKVYEGNYLMKFCIIDKKECQFEGFKLLKLERGKKYKIQYNFYYNSNYKKFYFPNVKSYLYSIQEFNNCIEQYETDGTEKTHYYLIKTKDYQKIYIYVKYGPVSYALIENKKDIVIVDEYYITLTAQKEESIMILKDYILLKIEDQKDLNNTNIIYISHYSEVIKDLASISLSLKKGECGLIKKRAYSSYSKYIILSSANNIGIIDLYSYSPPDNFSNIMLFKDNNSNDKDYLFIIDSSKDKSIVNGFIYKNIDQSDTIGYYYNTLFFNIILNDDISNSFNEYKSDFMFKRFNTYISDFGFNTTYFFGFEQQEYYLYIKKHYGNSAIYRYTQQLDSITDIMQFQKPYFSYENSNNYQLINNELLNITKYQLFTFIMNYNSLYDVYIQKIDDYERIQLNPNIFPFNNLVKLFKGNKYYNLDFTLDHLIKLDSNFLDAEVIFTNENGDIEVLNKDKKVLVLTGNNFIVKSNANALLYFYKKIPNNSNKGRVIFDKTEKGKNMKFHIKKTGGFLVKDFCFEGYYPILNSQNWQKINKNEVYIDNIIDNLEYDLYENENYIIYIFDSFDENNFPIFGDNEISNIQYISNLLSTRNKYNFEVIPGNSNGNLILNSVNKSAIYYQFNTCKNERIKFKYENSSGQDEAIFTNESAYFSINNDEILINSFESENEFLFAYTFQNKREPSSSNIKDLEALIHVVEEVSRNIVRIIFNVDSNLRKYYIVIAKKDEYNNNQTFSDPCYVAKLMTSNSNLIVVKTIYESSDDLFSAADINITNLNIAENEELVAIVINQILISDKKYNFGKPSEYKLVLKEAKEAPAEQYIFVDSKDNNYFKFEYKHESDIDQLIIFRFRQGNSFLLVFNEINQTEYTIPKFSNLITITLNKSGTFYIYLYQKNMNSDYMNYYITGKTISTIDLTERIYMKKTTDILIMNKKPNPEKYIVNNLQKDTYVFFTYTIWDYSWVRSPFMVCNNKNECSNNVVTYNFLKGLNYSIYIDFIPKYYYIPTRYYFPSFYFFPIFEDTIEVKETGYYFFSLPKIFVINIEKNSKFTAMIANAELMFLSTTNNISLEYLNQIMYKNESLIQIQTIANDFRHKYGVIATIPSFNENLTKIIIADSYITNVGEYSFSANTCGIIDKLDGYPRDDKGILYYNDLVIFSSPLKNMKIIETTQEHEGKDYIVLNKYVYPIYVDKYENSFNIKVKKHYGKFAVFGVLNDFLYNKTLYDLSVIEGLSDIKNIESRNSLNLIIDTNINTINEYFNFFIYNLTKKINIYLKNYYGNAEIYQDTTNYYYLRNFSALSKPMKTFQGKKTLFNRIFNLNNNKSIVGHLTLDSLFYLYVEIDDGNSTINRNPYIPNLLYNDCNTAKYLKKGIVYSVNFTVDHLFKLEPGFDAEVTIYNDQNKKIVLNSNKRTGKLKGNNVKIISNNNAMIYLYGRLFDLYSEQYKLENQPGKNLEIRMSTYSLHFIDFGFKGFEPNNIRNKKNYQDKYIFIENIYDRLEGELVEGENLYLLTQEYNIIMNIKYTENLRHKNNKYNFIVIPMNTTNKTLIINKGLKKNIKYQVNFCKSPHNIELYYAESYDNKEISLQFNEKKTEINSENLRLFGSIKLRFESDNDFIFSYSFNDEVDHLININSDYFDERRKIGTNFTIDVTKKYPNDEYSNEFTITFQPNYYNSSTKYIIVIANLNDDNSFENMSNPCYISKLATERPENSKIIDIVDLGENNIISVDVDIYDILSLIDEYIVNIISLELRFDKKLNFYIPSLFNHKGIKPKDIKLFQKQEFISNQIFHLPYKKQSLNTEIFLLHYQLEEESMIIINIEDPLGQKRSFIENKKNGYINFSFDEGGLYKIMFDLNSLYNKLNDNQKVNRGAFSIISTEYPLEINIKETNFDFDEINITEAEIDSLIFNISKIEKDYIKKITIENKEFFEMQDTVSIKKGNEEYKSLNFSYYLFEKNVSYLLKIKFNKNNENNYILDKFNIKDYSLDNIKNFSFGKYSYKDTNDKFLIINWTNYNNIKINIENNKTKFFKGKLKEKQIKNLVNEFQNIKFEKLEDLFISKQVEITYEVLMIELKENNTLIKFTGEKIGGNNGKTYIYIIVASVSLLVILIAIFFIVRHFRRGKTPIEYVSSMKEEKLMSDI